MAIRPIGCGMSLLQFNQQCLIQIQLYLPIRFGNPFEFELLARHVPQPFIQSFYALSQPTPISLQKKKRVAATKRLGKHDHVITHRESILWPTR